jgi:PDZ domain-containing protein
MGGATVRWKFLAIALPIVLVIGWALNVSLSVYAISPGNAIDVNQIISVNGITRQNLGAPLYMTDVGLTRVTPLLWLVDHFNGAITLVPASSVVGTDSSVAFDRSQLSQMADAKIGAAVAALNFLGRKVPTRYGAEILTVLKGTPASHGMQVGDLVYAVNGVQTPSTKSFAETVAGFAPGSRVQLSVLREESSGSGVRAREVQIPLTLGTNPNHKSRAFLGVEFTQGAYYQLPISVKIRTGSIGGPSAGLAFTLGLIEQLEGRSITHGLVVAATGTIGPNGTVGDVGGVAQKAIAVRDAGAQVFFVPKVELKAARSQSGPKMQVFGVSTLAQVVSILNKLPKGRKSP